MPDLKSWLHFWMVRAGSMVASRFSSREQRFRSAIGAGFALVLVGVATLGGGRPGSADDLFGGFGGLFGVPTQAVQPRPVLQVRRAHAGLQYRARRSAHRGGADAHLASTAAHKAPVRLGRLSMCVRSCDGFAFPVGVFHGDEDRAAHEASCRTACPGARTSLYVLPNGTDAIGEAIDIKTGRTYSQMPHAFRYTTYVEQTCSCHPREGSRIASLLKDFTLRRGDAVMTSGGLKVFHGGAHYPYRREDFVALARSRDVGERERPAFRAVERASMEARASTP